MDRQIFSLFEEQKFADLDNLLKQSKTAEVLEVIDQCIVGKRGDPAVLVKALFSGCPSATADGVKRRMPIIKHLLKTLQCHELGSKVSGEVIGTLLYEMDALPAPSLVELLSYFVDGIKTGSVTSPKCLELFPKILSAVESKSTITLGENEMTGIQYRSHVLNSLCSCRWHPSVVLHVVAMLRDIQLSNDELGHFVAKTVSLFTDVDQQELPPLVYQLLLLSAKGHKRTVLEGVIAHFIQLDAKFSTGNQRQSDNDCDSLMCDDYSNDSDDHLHHVEGTVILHITFAVKQDQQLGREFVKFLKAGQQFALCKVLSPFTSALALSVGQVHSFEEPIFELLKSGVLKSYRDGERQRLSQWVRGIVTDKCDTAAEQILDTIKNSVVGWDHITQGLVQLGFTLMESFGPRAVFGKVVATAGPSKSAILNPGQAACQLGVRILQETFRVHESARMEIIDRLINNIVTRATAPIGHYLDLLSSMIKTFPHVLLESLPRLRDALDYLLFLPFSTADGFLSAIQPLLKLSTALQDAVVLVLRKAVFSRQNEARRIAVSGFLMLLNNFRVLGNGLSLSQSSQSSYSGSSQLQVDIHHVRHSDSLNEGLCLEILSTLRRSLTQQAEIRHVLYEGLCRVLSSNMQLSGPIISVLVDQFRQCYEPQEDVNPPIKLELCTAQQGDQPYVNEPLGHLLSCLCQCVLLAKQAPAGDDFDKENCDVVSRVEGLLENLTKRMIKSEPEDFELDKSADFSPVTSVGIGNTIRALLLCGVYEVLIEYQFFAAKDVSLDCCETIAKLFSNYRLVNDMLKTKPVNSGTTAGPLTAGAGGKKKGRPAKDTGLPKTNEANCIKIKSSMLSMRFLTKILSAIYSDDMPRHQQGIAVLRSNIDLICHLVSSTIAQLQQLSQSGINCGGSVELTVKHCSRAACIMLKQYATMAQSGLPSVNSQGRASDKNESSRQKALTSLCLDGFAQATILFCTQFRHRLYHYLNVIDECRSSEISKTDDTEEQAKLYRLIQRLQRSVVYILTSSSGNEDRPLHDAFVLLSVIKELSQLLNTDGSALKDLESWLLRLCKEQSIDDLSVTKSLMQLVLVISRRQSSAVELTRDVCRDIHICLRDIDQEVEVDESNKSFGIIGIRSAPVVLPMIVSHLDVELDDVEWIVTREKTELVERSGVTDVGLTQREALDKAICTRLGHVINAFHELFQTALPIGPCVDVLLKAAGRLFVVLTLFVKVNLLMYTHKSGHMGSRFEKLVKLSATNLTPFVYTFITYVQSSQSEQLQVESGKPKKKNQSKTISSSDKNRALKETRSIPSLIYYIEEYEKYLIQLSRKSKVDLTAHLKMSTSRDFRINVAALQAAIDRDDQQSGDESEEIDNDDENSKPAADDQQHSTAKMVRGQTAASEDEPPASKKSKLVRDLKLSRK